MKFYGRKQEIADLNRLLEQAKSIARMTVLTGRRRVGKTSLALEFIKGEKCLYFFVSKKQEALLCEEYLQEIKNLFPDGPIVGEIRLFKDIFNLLIDISKKENFTLIVDEFQNFYNINESVYSDIQKLWDVNKKKCHLNVIFIGSVYSLMHKIFQNSKEPLFNRPDRVLTIHPFSIRTIGEILHDYGIKDQRILFDYYVFTGGMPKYIDLLVENKAFSFNDILDFMIEANSPFIDEGKNILIEEFGKEYGTYFSILELISVGKTARTEIESILESDIGGYLDRLENDYAVIAKHKPFNAKPKSRSQKYFIVDNFINFWFRFIYRNRSAIETGNYEYIKELIKRDYSTYCGKALEKFYHQLFAETGRYNNIGYYWEKGNQNEIDLVAVNDLRREIVIAEIKMNKMKASLGSLKKKAERLMLEYSKYKFQYLNLGLDDIRDYFSNELKSGGV